MQGFAGSSHGSGTYPGDGHGIVSISANRGKAQTSHQERGTKGKIAMEMTVYGKHGKPKAGFPPFPQPLEIPQDQRDSHIPTATMTVHIKVRTKTKPHQTSASQGGPKQTAEVGQMKLPNAHHTKTKPLESFNPKIC